ncbi:FAD-binding oxidoreductase [Bradyrhizobium canariense]|uniref:FAD-binding oxidoreductase n=1 Tax=Bradyrhizobium canariense TaxID=255045 RepID=UPI001C681788|nr:FAD-binding oxidoreductase [Bradyrhizobium canariense]MBW5437532.1 FAD-binding oxidoreductase [Bradyrhizobium canariense]
MNDVVARLRELLGSDCITDPALANGYLSDWRGLLRGNAACVLRPRSTSLLSQSVRICRGAGVGVVPQGGNTGLIGGSTPDETGLQVVINTGAMKKIRTVDQVDMSVIAEAGATIAELQSAAAEAGALFPLSFASEGTATLGGALATNAGGISAVRYGSARDLLLGMEVVLPDGRIWNGLRTLRKDNTGYALKHLFAGSEGTLGIITAAAMKLAPLPVGREVAFCAVETESQVLDFWMKLRAAADGNVRAIEYLSGSCVELAKREGLRSPVEKADHYVLVELTSSRPGAGLKDMLEAFLADRLEDGTIVDASLAQSGEQQKQIWRLREDQTELQKKAGRDIKHDVAVPVANVPELLRRSCADVEASFPDVTVVPFGHVGGGNIHLNVVLPAALGAERAAEQGRQISQAIYDIVLSLGGAFSAEHGIGRAKVGLLESKRDPVEFDLMRRIKAALNEDGSFNSGKIFRPLQREPAE